MNQTFGAIILFGMTSINKKLFGVVDNKRLIMIRGFVLPIGAIQTGDLDLVFGEEPNKWQLDFGQAEGQEEGLVVYGLGKKVLRDFLGQMEQSRLWVGNGVMSKSYQVLLVLVLTETQSKERSC